MPLGEEGWLDYGWQGPLSSLGLVVRLRGPTHGPVVRRGLAIIAEYAFDFFGGPEGETIKVRCPSLRTEQWKALPRWHWMTLWQREG